MAAHSSRSSATAVLMGGMSPEHEVSLASGRKVAVALSSGERPVLSVVLQKDGRWRFPEKPGAPPPEEGAGEVLPLGSALDRLGREAEVAFLALHGPFGEDGTIQGMLDLAGIPYTGSGVLASSLAMDKERSLWIFRHHGLPVPTGLCVGRDDWTERSDQVLRELGEGVPRPWVVKPVDQGSSVGIRLVDEEDGLAEALREGFGLSGRVLVEERIPGDELTCGVLEELDGGGPRALPVTLIRPREDAFFDYHAKYTPGATEEITPAPIDGDLTATIQEISLRAFRALGCRGMARFDFMLRGETPCLLEGNTIPGMTETSLLPQAAEAAGLSFPMLVERLVDLALERDREGPEAVGRG